MPGKISIRFYEELNDFLPEDRRKVSFSYALDHKRSVKDLIESLGIPHTEVDLIIVNGESVDFDYHVKNNDNISVYPVFESLDISPLVYCQPAPLRQTRFVLDAHLGRLAAYLRLLGFDSLYRNDYDDTTLADISADEHRILLTCDRRLLMRKQITHGYFVRSRLPHAQVPEVLTRFDLYNNLRPLTRCIHCNGITRKVDKKDIETFLLPKTRQYYNEFWQCNDCKKIYWKGSHYQRMQDLIDNFRIQQ